MTLEACATYRPLSCTIGRRALNVAISAVAFHYNPLGVIEPLFFFFPLVGLEGSAENYFAAPRSAVIGGVFWVLKLPPKLAG